MGHPSVKILGPIQPQRCLPSAGGQGRSKDIGVEMKGSLRYYQFGGFALLLLQAPFALQVQLHAPLLTHSIRSSSQRH